MHPPPFFGSAEVTVLFGAILLSVCRLSGFIAGCFPMLDSLKVGMTELDFQDSDVNVKTGEIKNESENCRNCF